MPVTWDEVVPGLDARRWTIANALERVTSWPGDPCIRVLDERPDLAAVLDKLGQLAKE